MIIESRLSNVDILTFIFGAVKRSLCIEISVS